jgi:hypothetical protein
MEHFMSFLFGKRKDKDDEGEQFLDKIQKEVQDSLLTQEQIYNQLRMTGEEARATILNMMDTGVRIGDNAAFRPGSVSRKQTVFSCKYPERHFRCLAP